MPPKETKGMKDTKGAKITKAVARDTKKSGELKGAKEPKEPREPREPKDAEGGGQNWGTFSNKAIRKAFISKVYGLLSIQLLFATCIILTFSVT